MGMGGMGQMGMGQAGMGQMGMGGMQGMGCCSMCPMCQGMSPAGGDMLPEQMLNRLVREIGLTGEQVEQILGILLDFRKTRIRLTSEMQIVQIDLQKMLMQDTVDKKKVEQQVRDLSRMQGDLNLAGAQAVLAARDVLTPEQRRKAVSLLIKGFYFPGGMAMPAGQGPMAPGMTMPPAGQGPQGPMAPGMSMPPAGPPQAPGPATW
jgi:Spy/CpxP family protein refolding chaperone